MLAYRTTSRALSFLVIKNLTLPSPVSRLPSPISCLVSPVFLPFPPSRFDLSLEIDSQLSSSGLIECFSPSQGLVEYAKLIFTPIRFPDDRSKITVVIARPRRANTIGHHWIHRDHHRRNSAFFYPACDKPESLMT
jgi:hypothetical protein